MSKSHPRPPGDEGFPPPPRSISSAAAVAAAAAFMPRAPENTIMGMMEASRARSLSRARSTRQLPMTAPIIPMTEPEAGAWLEPEAGTYMRLLAPPGPPPAPSEVQMHLVPPADRRYHILSANDWPPRLASGSPLLEDQQKYEPRADKKGLRALRDTYNAADSMTMLVGGVWLGSWTAASRRDFLEANGILKKVMVQSWGQRYICN